MKRIIVAAVLTLTAVAPAAAGGFFKQERPCGTNCSAPKVTVARPVAPVLRGVIDGDTSSGELIYESHSHSVFGNRVINGTYRVYRDN